MKGKLIVIEGTDCSGKETQSNMLLEKLNNKGIKTVKYSFPMYDTPTGKIIGGPYLGKSYICDGWFPETAPNVDAKVSCLYYAADRAYNIGKVLDSLNKGYNVVLDRYTFSATAHQGSKLKNKKDREKIYSFVDKLEFELLGLPRPDIKLFLHMPYEAACILKEGREELSDQLEANKEHLINAEKAYIEVAKLYNFNTIECSKKVVKSKEDIRTIEDISDEVYNVVTKELNVKK